MTGYGKAEIQLENKNILLELKSLNSKNLDISVRLPHEIREIELSLRKLVGKELFRGKIDLNVKIDRFDRSLEYYIVCKTWKEDNHFF